MGNFTELCNHEIDREIHFLKWQRIIGVDGWKQNIQEVAKSF